METQKAFDLAKKAFDGGDIESGYVIDNSTYNAYYTKADWLKYVIRMEARHKDAWQSFKAGGGKELEEKFSVRYQKWYPPKMASYASSSRFMYELGLQFPDFQFEIKLSTGMGRGKANLDGYLASKNVYVEAKCHEIYKASKAEYNEAHAELYKYLKENCYAFDYKVEDNVVSFLWNGKDVGRFDLKQMLCHLSGIARSKFNSSDKRVNFVYLVYSPSEEMLKSAQIDNSAKQRIKTLYDEEKENAMRIDFTLIYKHIIKYFKPDDIEDASLTEMERAFKFFFRDQNNFKETITNLD